jgi:hypothetical protein
MIHRIPILNNHLITVLKSVGGGERIPGFIPTLPSFASSHPINRRNQIAKNRIGAINVTVNRNILILS